MKIFFSGSATIGMEDVEIYFQIIEILKTHGQVLTEHVGDRHISSYGDSHLTDVDIYNRDVAWIDESDVLVAEVTKTSIGVGYEIGHAESKHKKVLCLYRDIEGRKLSSMIVGNSNVKTVIYKDIEELPEIFNTFFK